MSSSPGAGRAVLGPGQGTTWVGEHGAHLMDYAAYHLTPDRVSAAVASALAACLAQPAAKGITPRGQLLAVLRRDCRAAPGYREQYVPEAGPGMPDARLIERVWTIVDPLGTETLRLMYRHELAPLDLSHMLAMPVDEVGRLATRTQDLIETLVSGLDAIEHGRHTCPDLSPLVDALFPGGLSGPGEADETGEAGEQRTLPPAEFDSARTDLLSHMITCSVCTRPINIRYTVPQMISHPRIAPLTAEVRKRLLDSLPPAAEPPLPGSGTAPAGVPDPGPRPTSQEETQPGRAIRTGRPARPDRSTLPYLPVRPDRSTTRRLARSDHADRPDRPERADRSTRPDRTDHPDRSKHPGRPARPDRSDHADGPDRPDRPDRTERSDRSTLPYRPVLPDRAASPSPPARPAGPLSAPPVSGQDTPLYDALLSQAWAREVLAADDGTATNPAIPAVTGKNAARRARDARAPVIQARAEPADGPEGVRFGPGVRFMEALAWAGERVRSTTIKIVIIVVAGAAGTLTGMNLLGPAIGVERPAGSLQSSASQATATGDAPQVAQGELAGRLRIPPVITLDEFGQGSLILTVSGASLDWRITAPGLSVTPSSGTLKQGRTDVIVLRAHRIRHWCGVPSSVTAPLTVHGPDDSITTTVRWSTC
ncbi:hypothetical protein [Streptosporangium roseum]|uniref:Uncharacterized protein n=1 Tax=Streptosporangium roseum (strain ATCC 12428 / DSM 43021 / JCM 3005 / KCTC 9067 / NCIMB 10171 / NRRL 2505 / NI 9100) TaxID=479432 RepID=D2BCP9_STRRD|nr:hypothetical protein [Streptosporangium roseum]ACZ91869.1 hypothetical protein Sros_9251 [Streptosporangium roseum DSM 43021]